MGPSPDISKSTMECPVWVLVPFLTQTLGLVGPSAFIQMNITFQYPGVTDLDYLGAGKKFRLCFAESEEANP
jgi:hypothetical protein